MTLLSIPIVLALTASPDAGAQPVPVWTEADALAAWERGSQALVDARAAEAGARGDLTQAGLIPNPSFSVSADNLPLRPNPPPAGNGPAITRNLVTSLGLSQPVELGGKRGKRIAQARSALDAASAGSADAQRVDRYEVRRAFWHAVRVRDRRALAEQASRRSEETVRISRVRFETQDISRADLEKVELEAMKLQNDLADARTEERGALAELLMRVGSGAPTLVSVSGDLAQRPVDPDEAKLVVLARQRRPDLRAARARADAARAALALAEAQAIPDLTVGVGYTRSFAVAVGDNPDSLGVNLSLPLPLFHRNQGEIQKARIEADRAGHAADALEARIAQEVAAALSRYDTAGAKVDRYDGGALQRADHALQVAESTWRAGDRSLLEYLEAERTWIELRGDYLDTLFELRQARYELERAVAGPFEENPS